MSDKPKAIETYYKGFRFRSRLEAKWAVFLDSFGEKWEYEKQGYALKSGAYLPDFFLPRLKCWLEIKGPHPTKTERDLCMELGEFTSHPVVLAWGIPESFAGEEYEGRLTVFCVDTNDSGGGVGEWDRCYWSIDNDGRLCICANFIGNRWFGTFDWEDFPALKLTNEIAAPIASCHVDNAKNYRFGTVA